MPTVKGRRVFRGTEDGRGTEVVDEPYGPQPPPKGDWQEAYVAEPDLARMKGEARKIADTFAAFRAYDLGLEPMKFEDPKYRFAYTQRIIARETRREICVFGPGRRGLNLLVAYAKDLRHRKLARMIRDVDTAKKEVELELFPDVKMMLIDRGFEALRSRLAEAKNA